MPLANLTVLLLIVSCQASAGSCSGPSCTNHLDAEESGNLNLLQTSYSVKAGLSPNDIPADIPRNNMPSGMPSDMPINDMPSDMPPSHMPPRHMPPSDMMPSDMPPSHMPPSDITGNVTGRNLSCVQDAKFATRASNATFADYTEIAKNATFARDSEEADHAENADEAKYAKNAKRAMYAIHARDARHICGDTYIDGEPQACEEMRFIKEISAGVGDDRVDNTMVDINDAGFHDTKSGSANGANGNNRHGAEVCDDPGQATNMYCADYALCAENAIEATNAKNAKYSIQALNAGHAKKTKLAENAEDATHAESADWSEYALYARETFQQWPPELVQKAAHRPMQLFEKWLEKWQAKFVNQFNK